MIRVRQTLRQPYGGDPAAPEDSCSRAALNEPIRTARAGSHEKGWSVAVERNRLKPQMNAEEGG
jgi:hypothetical protein